MVLDENILSKNEYEKALAGKHILEMQILYSSDILMKVMNKFALGYKSINLDASSRIKSLLSEKLFFLLFWVFQN